MYASLKFLASVLNLAVKRICEEFYEKNFFAFLLHLLPAYSKAVYIEEE